MCGSARYWPPGASKPYAIGYGYSEASMPVLRSSGEVEWIKWGRRKGQEIPGLPVTGWARWLSVQEGKWNRYQPEFVELAVQQFGEKDENGKRHWFQVPDGCHIQALIATGSTGESRLFVVTVETPPEYAWIHDRYPRIVPETEALPLEINQDGSVAGGIASLDLRT